MKYMQVYSSLPQSKADARMSVTTEDWQISANQHVQVFKRPHNSSLVVGLCHTALFILQ